MTEYQVAALWMGGGLSFLEQLCLKSFVDAGQHIILFHYEDIPNVPEGVEMRDANEIMPQTGFLTHERTGSPALHSDLFRYHMLAKMDRTIWADTDAYCVKPFTTPNGHFYAWESDEGLNGGVLGLPKDSDTLREVLEFTKDEFAIPPFKGVKRYSPKYIRELQDRKAAGNPVHCSEMPWGVWGPHLLTHFLKETGEVKYAMPRVALYPFAYEDRRLMLRPGVDVSAYVTDETFSIHFYGRRMRARILDAEPDGIPRPRTLIGQLLKLHKIDPRLAPIKRKAAPVLDDDEE